MSSSKNNKKSNKMDYLTFLKNKMEEDQKEENSENVMKDNGDVKATTISLSNILKKVVNWFNSNKEIINQERDIAEVKEILSNALNFKA